MMRKALMLVTATASLAVLAGCPEQRESIDRVQPLALDKTFFVGEDLQSAADDPEFWTQGTLIDVGYGAAQDGLFTSTYAQPVSRLRWQITEDLLVGRLAYERIEGTDGKGAGRATEDGVIVVAYPIESHFDIVRAYNPTTGEQLNIWEENTTDRPWYQRKYMRVDWSQNLNTDSYDFDTLSMVGVYGGVTYEPLAYDVTDPADPNAPVFDLENGYFDVTNKAFARPGLVDLSALGWGVDSFPACFLDADFSGGTAPAGSCNPVELTIRQSFRRVENNDFQPRDWDGIRFQSYGGFYTDRYGYARNYGMSDDLWRRFLNHHQIWERTHFYTDPAAMTGALECYTPTTTPFGQDPHRDEDANGTEDECEAAGPGSTCDTFTQRCTLPFAQRKTTTLAWYFTHDSDPEYFLPTRWAAQQWDVALRMAVRASQYAECRNTGGADCATRFPVITGQQEEYEDVIALATEIDDCRDAGNGASCDALADSLAASRGYGPAVVSLARMPDMVVLCHSPVEALDPAACGDARLPAGTTSAQCEAAYDDPLADPALLETCRAARNVRRGDLRYHQVNVIPEPQSPSPWGIMVDSIDPLTGESIAASINVWSFVNDFWSQDVVDKLRYLKGEYVTEDVTNGTYVRNWSLAAQAASGNGVLPMLTRSELDRRLADFAGGPPIARELVPEELAQQLRTMDRDLREVSASLGAPSSNAPIYEARKRQARGTEFEAQLMTPMVQQLHGVDGLPLNDSLLELSSPLRGGHPEFRQELARLKEEALAKRGACILHPDEAEAPFSLTGLSNVLEQKFGAFNPSDPLPVQQARAEKMRQYVALRAHFAVIAHEMGHSIGLRHNFLGSSDAWQYRPQYWQLRTRNGATTTECTELATDGATCVGPRYFDPVTPEERDGLIWMWAQSSVMDYPGEATQDMIGLGIYDFAATRMLYGETVAVNADERFRSGTALGTSLLDLQDTFGGILGLGFTVGDEDIHYSQLQKNYGLISGCVDVPDPTVFRPANWDEARLGAWSPLLDGLMVQVDGQWSRCKQQQVDYVPWSSLRAADGTVSATSKAIDGQGRVRQPYGFATDRWADLGNLSVYRHDNGADPYEIFNFMITSQELWQVFDSYRRHRQTFSVRNAADRVLNRYNAKIRDGAKGLGLMRNIYEDFALHQGYDFDTFWRIVAGFYPDNILASGLAFDHFARTLARPEIGPHYRYEWEEVLRSAMDAPGTPDSILVNVPNGASGYYGAIGMGGKLVENQLCGSCGEFDSDYTMNAGSYYDKMNAAMLMTESVDNFISASRTDFVDPRYRAVSLADLFPEGFRRWLGNNLTGDELLKGPRLAADSRGNPLKDAEGYPEQPIGWTTWWGETPQACFPNAGTTLCSSYNMPTSDPFDPRAPTNVAVLDPQVGWEQQKFLIAWTMLYLPENERMGWLDLMRVWELGQDADPAFTNRIEFHSPDGKIYVARTFGKEDIFGETVQKGIAARVLEYADDLTVDAYAVDNGPDVDGDTIPDWHIPVVSTLTGLPVVKYDPTVAQIDADGYIQRDGIPGCNATDNSLCTCTANRACVALQRYLTVPAYLREAISAYRLGEPDPRGVY
jgi:hypothetical protein